jgi:uncharacterized membrane protein YhhN
MAFIYLRIARPILTVALILGVSHILTWSFEFADPLRLIWKFLCVGSLALYASSKARNTDGWVLAALLFISAASDVLLEIVGQIRGALTFIVADILGILLYVRNLRPHLGRSSWLLAALALIACVLLAYVLPARRDEALGIAVFVIPLALMTIMGSLSQFSWRFVGLGTLMILSSDMLIFARMGPLEWLPLINQTIWLLYFLGEFLVAIGVVRGLRERP